VARLCDWSPSEVSSTEQDESNCYPRAFLTAWVPVLLLLLVCELAGGRKDVCVKYSTLSLPLTLETAHNVGKPEMSQTQ